MVARLYSFLDKQACQYIRCLVKFPVGKLAVSVYYCYSIGCILCLLTKQVSEGLGSVIITLLAFSKLDKCRLLVIIHQAER